MSKHKSIRRDGFTIIELLIVIFVVGLLIGLLLPALSAARLESRSLRSVSNLRQIGSLFELYLDANADTYPRPRVGVMYPYSCRNTSIGGVAWQETFWPWLIQDIAPWRDWSDVFLSPTAASRREPGTCLAPPSYSLANSFVGRPELWGPVRPANPQERIRDVRRADVLHTSSKVMLWDSEMPYLNRPRRRDDRGVTEPTPILFVDGHARRGVPVLSADPVQNHARSSSPRRFSDTPNGVRGIDYSN